MAGSLNEATIIGRLGRDPEIRTLNSGDKVANLRVATDETWKDKTTGERKSKTEWHAVTIFNEGIVKVCENYLQKGSLVFLRGALQTRKYEQNGVEKFTTEIVLQKFRGELTMLGGRPNGGSEADDQADSYEPPAKVGVAAVEDDEIIF